MMLIKGLRRGDRLALEQTDHQIQGGSASIAAIAMATEVSYQPGATGQRHRFQEHGCAYHKTRKCLKTDGNMGEKLVVLNPAYQLSPGNYG
jgi:hypothetical protein